MIRRLLLPDFGKFRKTELDFGPFTVITGPNEAGKTTVFDALFDTLCAGSRHEGRPLWKNLAARYTALRKAELVWEEGASPLAFEDNEFIEIFAIRGGELGVKHPENKGASAWAQAAENALLNSGLNPEQLAAELADKASSVRKGSVQAGIKRLREAIRDHEQAISGLKAEHEAVLADAGKGPLLEADKKRHEAALAEKNAELKAKEEALAKLSASVRRAAVMAGITALRELKEAREAAAALAAYASDETPLFRALQSGHQDAEKRAAVAAAALEANEAAVEAAKIFIVQLAERENRAGLLSGRAAGLAEKLEKYASEPGKVLRTTDNKLRAGIWIGGALLAAFVAFSGRNTGAYAAAAAVLAAAAWAGFKFSIAETLVGRSPEEVKAFLSGLAADWPKDGGTLPAADLETARTFLSKVKADHEAAIRTSAEKAAELVKLASITAASARNKTELDQASAEALCAEEKWLKERGCQTGDDYQARTADYKKRAERAADREQRVLALAGGSGCSGEEEFKDKLFAENGELERRGVVPVQGADAELARLKHELAELGSEARNIEAALNKANTALQTNLAVSGARLGGLPERINQAETVVELDKEELADLELQSEAYSMASRVFRTLAETSVMAFEALGKEVTATLRAALPEAYAEFRGFEAGGAAVTDASGITRPVRNLSSGMRDLFLLAARLTMARRARLGPDGLAPSLLVLDEPFYTLDPARERLALKLLAAFHKSTGWQIIILTKDAAIPAAAKAEGLQVTEVPLTALS